MPLSRTKTKGLIFDTLASFFEKNGTTTCITVDEVVGLTIDRPNRIQSLLDEMVGEEVIYKGCDDPNGYRLTGSAYMQLCLALQNMGRLPDGVKLEFGNIDDFDDNSQEDDNLH